MNSTVAFFAGAWVGATVSPLLLGIMMLIATRTKDEQK